MPRRLVGAAAWPVVSAAAGNSLITFFEDIGNLAYHFLASEHTYLAPQHVNIARGSSTETVV